MVPGLSVSILTNVISSEGNDLDLLPDFSKVVKQPKLIGLDLVKLTHIVKSSALLIKRFKSMYVYI